MKLRLLSLLLLLCGSASFAADTLKQYNPAAPLLNLPTGYKELVGRVDLPGPGMLSELVVRLGGSSADGTVKLKLYGHEAGTSFPQLEKTIAGPLELKKSKEGNEEVHIKLPEPIRFANNQLFVVLSDWSANVTVLAEGTSALAECSSSSGGDYYRLFAKNTNNSWALVNRRALAIDLVWEAEKLPASAWFEDRTKASGIAETLSNKSIAAGDLNGDDFLDLCIRGSVYFNQKDFTFTDKTADLNITTTDVVASPLIDINNDGKLDILLLYGDSVNHKVLVNQGGGQFQTQELSAEIPVRGISSFSIADINKDGFPDIFVGRLWTMYPAGGPDITPNYLYLNDGKGDFTDASTLIYPNGYTHRRSRGSAWCDYDNDGDLDLFVANYYLEADELWRNNGNGTFTDYAAVAGIDRNKFQGSSHGTGCDWGDYDNDGFMDLLSPNLAHPAYLKQYDHFPTTLYRNKGGSTFYFANETANSGIEYEETHAGAAWADFNNDGKLDFVVTTFYGCRYIDLYQQQEDGSFGLVTAQYGLEGIVTGEDACWADLDNDGKLDLMMGEAGKFKVWKNNTPVWHHHFCEVELEAGSGNKLAIGSRVTLYAGGKSYIRDVTAGRGVRMQPATRVHFGLAETDQVDSVKVFWYGSGQNKTYTSVQADKLNFLSENGTTRLDVKEEELSLGVYPNPNSGSFKVEVPIAMQLEILDATGKQLQLFHLSEGQHTLDLRLSPGVYVLYGKLEGGKVYRKRITIQR
ncbi:MAG: T9SS type A sorting domain-containing protein [Bacteroidetes bacterium]|nr:MAG: T9SS type A sorting domain-containing protein [Bacteroidota bacterium]